MIKLLSDNIRNKLKAMRKTEQQLALWMNVPMVQLQSYLKGEQTPWPSEIDRLCNIVALPRTEICQDDGQENPNKNKKERLKA